MYRVIKYFTDLQDNDHEYNVGDIYPHNKKNVSASRIKELSTDKNRRGVPLIEKVEEPREEFEPVLTQECEDFVDR